MHAPSQETHSQETHSQETRPSPSQRGEGLLKESAYDRVASLLVSLLIVIGACVALLLIAWVTRTLTLRRGELIVTPIETPARRSESAGFDQIMAQLGREEMPELTEPQFGLELEAVNNAVSPVVASLHQFEGPARRLGNADIDGTSSDSRPPDKPPNDIIPRWERWRIRWAPTNQQAYARQLDFFKIELGAAGGKPMLDYASNLSDERPEAREGPGRDERRLYMTWKDGTISKFDRAILVRAGIPTAGRLLLQFYPTEVEDQLARLELENAAQHGHLGVSDIRQTFFGVRPVGQGYEFVVEDQQFRAAPR